MAVINTITQESTYICTRCDKHIVKTTHDVQGCIEPPAGWRLMRLFHWDGTKNHQSELCDRCVVAATRFLAGDQIAPAGAL